MDFQQLASELLARSESLCEEWFPAGKKRGHEFQVGDLYGTPGKSLSINLNTGAWKDFASGEAGGDLIALYAAMEGVAMGEAYKQLTNGHAPVVMSRPAPPPKPKPASTSLKILMPVPESAEPADLRHPVFGEPVCHWHYRDADGDTLGYVARYEPAGDRKQIVPFVWADGKGWVMKQWPDPRPLYGLEILAARPDAPVLLTEGEKDADAARLIAGHIYVVMTWPGGSGAWKKADFSVLAGRKVLLWPDADDAGRKCVAEIGVHLLDIAAEVKALRVDGVSGDGAADFKGNYKEFSKWARERVTVMEKPAQISQPAPEIIDIATGEILPAVQRSSAVMSPIDMHAELPDTTDRGKILETIENVSEICRRLNVTVRYNVISKEEEILIPNESFSIDNKANASFAWLTSWCGRLRMPTGKLGDFVTYLADQNLYNPVVQWIESKPWDGRSRLNELYSTIRATGEADDTSVSFIKETLIKRWLISAVAAAYEPNGVSAHGVLVLQGGQYLGKTKWFKSLVPEHLGVIQDGMTLRPDDKDSVKQVCSFWLVELGELDATFRKSDIAALKAFLTRKQDVLRRAYARKESFFARRTVFFASVNPQKFLHDPTGNRRYWTISCEHIDHSHNIDMQQVWAEVHALYEAGESYFLTHDEMQLLNDHNEDFNVVDPIKERIISKLDWDAPKTLWKWMTATDVLHTIGIDRPTQSEAIKAGECLRKKNGDLSRKSNGNSLLSVPPIKMH